MGNRLTRVIGTTTDTYAYSPTANRISTITTGSNVRTFGYLASGQVSSDVRDPSHSYSFTANNNGRNASSALNSTTAGTYLYNAFEQRVQKTAGGVTTQFVYDSSGRLLEEANASGVAQKEYIWLDDTPVAIVDDTGTSPVLYFIQTDQLGTPQKITDGSMNIIWDGAFDPFGNPVTGGMGSATWGSAQWGGFSWGATGPNLSLTNLRFPGQYFDSETALNQNWNRDYDATVGRYLESDPLGFDGGTYLTYEYAGGNPINNDDPLGLFLFSVHQEITRAAMDQAGGADCPDLPWQVSQVDFLPGSQDTQNAYWHAMRNGRDPTNTVSAARKAFGKYVDVESRSCTCEGLARALHAVQDSHAAGHSGFQPWNGGIPSASHIWQDATPVSREWDGAVQDSAKLIRKYQKECKKDCVPH